MSGSTKSAGSRSSPARMEAGRAAARRAAKAGGLAVISILALGAGPPEDEPPLPSEEVALKLREARIAGMEGRIEEQRRRLEEIARQHPDDSSALLALLDLATSLPAGSAEAAKARDALRQLLFEPGRDAPLSVLEGFAHGALASVEDLSRLASILAAGSAEKADAPARLFLLGLIQERLGRFEDARATMGSLLERTGDPELRLKCIHLDVELERWEDALGLLETQRRIVGPEKMRLTAILVYAALGRLQELDREVAALGSEELLVGHNMLPLLLQVGFVLHDGGRTDRARGWFNRLAERFPGEPSISEILAGLYGSEGAPPGGAGKDGGRAERSAFDILNEGTALLAAGEVHAAYDVLERAVDLLGDNDVAWFNLGLAAADLQRWERAEEAFDRCVLLNPRFVRGLVQRAQSRLRLGRVAEAAADAERALELDRRCKDAVLILYHCAKARGDEKEATALMRRWEAM